MRNKPSITLLFFLVVAVSMFQLTQQEVLAVPPTGTPKEQPSKPLADRGEKRMIPVIFQRVVEPKEQAFSMLVPKGWIIEGGIFRVDPSAAGGPAQSIEAKLDFAVKSDQMGRVMLRRFPDWYYADVRHMPAGQMGLFPLGSNYQGMTVAPVLSPAEFISRIVLPKVHPQAKGVQVIEQRNLPALVQKYQQRSASMVIPANFAFKAAVLTIRYEENGTTYKEKVMTLIEDRSVLAGGQWVNRETLFFRAPVDEFKQWESVFSLMMASVKINPQWLTGEIRGIMTRSGTMHEVQSHIQEIDRQILEHKQKTNAEIHNDMFLTLTGQEEYVNPYTKEVETGSSQLGRYRWETEAGDVFYTDQENYNPSRDGLINRTDWKRSPVRPRFPQ